MTIRPESKNVEAWEKQEGLSGGANKFMKLRSSLYKAAGVLTATTGLVMSGVGVAMGSEQITLMGMGMLASTIVPAISSISVDGKITEANLAAKHVMEARVAAGRQ